jgi:hypothetical protein
VWEGETWKKVEEVPKLKQLKVRKHGHDPADPVPLLRLLLSPTAVPACDHTTVLAEVLAFDRSPTRPARCSRLDAMPVVPPPRDDRPGAGRYGVVTIHLRHS